MGLAQAFSLEMVTQPIFTIYKLERQKALPRQALEDNTKEIARKLSKTGPTNTRMLYVI